MFCLSPPFIGNFLRIDLHSMESSTLGRNTQESIMSARMGITKGAGLADSHQKGELEKNL
jgi:hypothetical protein